MAECQQYWYLISTTEKGLRGLGLMFIRQLKVSKNPSRVPEVGITINGHYSFCHNPGWVLGNKPSKLKYALLPV